MLEKLLRAPLPEQVVALLEKLEQDPDTSHLEKVERLMLYHKTQFTRYEMWVLKRALRKLHFTIQRAWTLEKTMSIVINEPEPENIVPSGYYINTALQNGASGLTAGAIAKAAHHHTRAEMDLEIQKMKMQQARMQMANQQGQYAPQTREYNDYTGRFL